MVANDGKFIEANVGKALSALLGNKAVAIRLQDSRSAYHYLPPSPGDFIGVFKGGIPVLIEVKSSSVNTRFTNCRVKDYLKPTQFGYHQMWLKMGGISVFLFHSVLTKELEYWGGAEVLASYSNGWTKNLITSGCKDTSGQLVADIVKNLPIFIEKTKAKG